MTSPYVCESAGFYSVGTKAVGATKTTAGLIMCAESIESNTRNCGGARSRAVRLHRVDKPS